MFKEDAGAAGLPPELAAAHKALSQIPDPVEKFRAYLQFLPAAESVLGDVNGRIRERSRALKNLESEIAFMARHRTRIETFLRASAGTYSTPANALSTVDHLTLSYSPAYVLEVAKLGSGRLGRPKGFGAFGYKTQTRAAADENYQRAVLPALVQLLNHHKTYLEIGGSGLEKQVDDVNNAVKKLERDKLALEGAVRQYKEEQLRIARTMTRDQVAQLREDEAKERAWLLPQSQREAEAEASPG